MPAPDPADEVGLLRSTVETRLEELASSGRTTALGPVLRYVLLAPGKRLRPILTVLASWELGVPGYAALDAGCALEMVHAASLVLDDLPCMDDASRRRGRASAHVAFGEDAAILSAIALLGRAFATVSSGSLDPALRARLAAILAEAVGPDGLCGGQFEDLRGPERARVADGVADANHLKTGVLFVAAIDMAAAIAGAQHANHERLRRFATHLGQAFQLLDDLDDGLPAGPTVAEDDRKTTLVTLLGRDDARRRLKRHLIQALDGLHPDGLLATFVSGLFGERRGTPSAITASVGAAGG